MFIRGSTELPFSAGAESPGLWVLFPYGTSDSNKKVYFASEGFETSCIISKEKAEKRNFEGVEQIETVMYVE